MRKLLIASVALIGMTTASMADGYPRHHHYNGGGNGGAIVGGIIGGLLIGGLLAGPRPGYYYDEYQAYPQYYSRCHTYFEGNYWNGYQWVSRYRKICD